MKKLLFIVRGYYPEISASGNLLKPLIEELAKENFVYVLSCSSDEKVGEFSSNLKYKKVKIGHVKANFAWKTISFLKKNLLFSFFNEEIVSALKNEIENLDRENNFDSIFAVTYEEIIALMNSSINYNKKKIFLLEKLPITSTIKIPFVYHVKLNYRKMLEKKIIEGFSKIYTLPIMYKYFSERITKKDKYKLVELEHPMVTNRTSISVNNTIPKLIYAGGLDRKQRNPSVIFEFFKKIHTQQSIEVIFYSYGNMQKKLLNLSENNRFFKANNAISSTLLNEKIAKSDFIITIGNNEEDLVPSKIFDCISTGKPIIHFSQIQNDPYKVYLSKYDYSIILRYSELNSDEAYNKILSFIDEFRGKTVEFSKIKSNFYECTPEYIAKKILKD